MKKLFLLLPLLAILLMSSECESPEVTNTTAIQEQSRVEENQSKLNSTQPSPQISWSLERDNLIKRFRLMNDRTVTMYMYVFIEGVGKPIGYYIVNKVSSVNSQLTNPNQLVGAEVDITDGNLTNDYNMFILPSPAEDGSYGTNGDGIFGFTPDGLYVEHNMKYIVATAPLKFKNVPYIGEISVDISNALQNKLKEFE